MPMKLCNKGNFSVFKLAYLIFQSMELLFPQFDIHGIMSLLVHTRDRFILNTGRWGWTTAPGSMIDSRINRHNRHNGSLMIVGMNLCMNLNVCGGRYPPGRVPEGVSAHFPWGGRWLVHHGHIPKSSGSATISIFKNHANSRRLCSRNCST